MLPPNFGNGRNKSCDKFHPFCMAATKVSKMQLIFIEIFKNLSKILRSVTEFNEK
jgi:hypothetical protein